MLIDYVSNAMDAQDFAELFQDKNKMPGQQAQKYNRLMIEGLEANGIKVRAVTGLPVTRRNCRNIYISSKMTRKGIVEYCYGSVLNIPVIKNLWQMTGTFFCVLKESIKGDNAIICDVLNASVSLGASIAAKWMKRPCIGIVTDLPQLMVTGTNQKHVKLVERVIKNCSGYVFLTEAMNNTLNYKKKPYVIIEGLCDQKMTAVRNIKNVKQSDVKICMYAGLLDARYGVKTMVEAFLMANMENTELHIYGNGPYVEELLKITERYKTVVYHGSLLNDEVVNAEINASLLINPRPTHEEFTKYSFPSKNIEYMVSGTPVLTTRLPGMPEEYCDYVYLFKGETAEEMSEDFKRVIQISDQELREKGKKARCFVLKNKSNIVQAKKIVSLIQ